MTNGPHAPHFHKDTNVDQARVRAFSDAPVDEQLEALTYLRMRGDFDITMYGAPFALVFALIALLLSVGVTRPLGPSATQLSEAAQAALALERYQDLFAWLTAFVLFGIVAIFLMVAGGIRQWLLRVHASVWIRAYEMELERRHQDLSWRNRKWRREHQPR